MQEDYKIFRHAVRMYNNNKTQKEISETLGRPTTFWSNFFTIVKVYENINPYRKIFKRYKKRESLKEEQIKILEKELREKFLDINRMQNEKNKLDVQLKTIQKIKKIDMFLFFSLGFFSALLLIYSYNLIF